MTGMMTETVLWIICWFGVFLAGELISLIAFGYIRAIHVRKKLTLEFGELAKEVKRKPVFTLSLDFDWLKGVLERAVLSIGLLAGYPHILTFFGALKIATGLNSRSQDKDAPGHAWSMDYFLIGNLVSALFAMMYVLLSREIWIFFTDHLIQ